MSSRSSAPRFSVVIAAYNEEASLVTLHEELSAALARVDGPAEILFVDDGSSDGTLDVLRGIAEKDPRVRVIALEGNHGQSAALDAGFRAVAGEITITLDADLQNDPADIPRMVEYLDRADVVNGVRSKRRDSWVRKVSSAIGNGFRNRMTRESVSDVGCSLRVMRTSYLRRVKLFQGMHRFLPTLLHIEGARLIEVPVSHRPRRHGSSKYGIGNRLLVGIADVFAVRWMMRRQLRYRIRE